MAQFLELVYDGDCAICQSCVRWVQRHDRSRRIHCVTASACQWPDAESQPFANTVVVRDELGATTYRSVAVAQVLSALPRPTAWLGRVLVRVFRVPLFRQLGDWGYDYFAAHRRSVSTLLRRVHLLGDVCDVPSSAATVE